jgi:hypothetical protein
MRIKVVGKKLINEAISLSNVPKKGTKVIRKSYLEELFRFFHLSTKKLHSKNEVFTFNPRIPNHPFQDADGYVIEDDYTKRISLATTINDAIEAIGEPIVTYYHVYACDVESRLDDDIDAVSLKLQLGRCDTNLSSRNNKYGKNFDMYQYLKRNKLSLNKYRPEKDIGPKNLPPRHKQKFFGCVPDSENHNEYWSLKDTTMYYIGICSINTSEDVVILDKNGSNILSLIQQEEASKNK